MAPRPRAAQPRQRPPGWDRIAGYYYPDSTIAGFSHTHLSGTGAGDLYDISFMPVTDPVRKADAPLGIHSPLLPRLGRSPGRIL